MPTSSGRSRPRASCSRSAASSSCHSETRPTRIERSRSWRMRSRGRGFVEPALFRFHGDAIEAKVMLGRLDEADVLLGQLGALHAERAWAQAIACRGRALLSAARGDLGRAHRGARASVRLARSAPAAVRACAHAARARKHASSRAQEAAGSRRRSRTRSQIFDQLGAALWAAKTRDELARVGGRAPADGTDARPRSASRELIASGLHLSRDSRRALHQPEDGAVEPVEDLPQARHPLADRTRGAARHRGRLAPSRR